MVIYRSVKYLRWDESMEEEEELEFEETQDEL